MESSVLLSLSASCLFIVLLQGENKIKTLSIYMLHHVKLPIKVIE